MSTVHSDLTGKVAVVTGASGGLGRVIAAGLARAGAHVVAVVRDPARAADLQAAPVVGDLSRRDEVANVVRTIAERHDQIHILVNNAGAHYLEHQLSPDGVEMHVALDYLAAYGMMVGLNEQLRRGRARIVNVASEMLNDTRPLKVVGRPRPATLDLSQVDDLAEVNPAQGFKPFEAYARAKLMTVTAGYALARDFAADSVTVNALHPGVVGTAIVDDLVPKPFRAFTGLIRGSMLSPQQGAEPVLRLATDPALDGVTGRYFNREAEASTPAVTHDLATQEKLIALSAARQAV